MTLSELGPFPIHHSSFDIEQQTSFTKMTTTELGFSALANLDFEVLGDWRPWYIRLADAVTAFIDGIGKPSSANREIKAPMRE